MARRRKVPPITDEMFDAMTRRLEPLPSPAWRWEAATVLAKGQGDELGSPDPDVAAAIEYWRALAVCTTEDERAAVPAQWPTITAAREIHERDDPQRWALEAWLLAGQPDDEIASRCNVPAAVVRVYARLFFALREHLRDADWLVTKLFGDLLSLEFDRKDVARFWAWVALAGPRAALAKFIDGFFAAWKPGVPCSLDVYLAPDARLPLNMQALLASLVLPRNTATAPLFFGNHLGLIEADRERDPLRKREKLDQLRRTMVDYAYGFLSGKTAKQLHHLLRRPPCERADRSRESHAPPIAMDPLESLHVALTLPREDEQMAEASIL